MEKKLIYQVVCFDFFTEHTQAIISDLTASRYGRNKTEFILGTYISEAKAIEVKDEMEAQAIKDCKSLEYQINNYVILDWDV